MAKWFSKCLCYSGALYFGLDKRGLIPKNAAVSPLLEFPDEPSNKIVLGQVSEGNSIKCNCFKALTSPS